MYARAKAAKLQRFAVLARQMQRKGQRFAVVYYNILRKRNVNIACEQVILSYETKRNESIYVNRRQ